MSKRPFTMALGLAALAAGSFAMYSRKCHRGRSTRARAAPEHYFETRDGEEAGRMAVDTAPTQLRSDVAGTPPTSNAP